jgi:hypothetical protein
MESLEPALQDIDIMEPSIMLKLGNSLVEPFHRFAEELKKKQKGSLASLGILMLHILSQHLSHFHDNLESHLDELKHRDEFQTALAGLQQLHDVYHPSLSGLCLLPSILDPIVCRSCITSECGLLNDWQSTLTEELSKAFPHESSETLGKELDFFWAYINDHASTIGGFAFWRAAKAKIPHLARLARKYFCIRI